MGFEEFKIELISKEGNVEHEVLPGIQAIIRRQTGSPPGILNEIQVFRNIHSPLKEF